MRSSRKFQPTLDTLPVRVTPSDLLLAPVVYTYTPPSPAPDPMAPVVLGCSTSSPITYANT